MMLSAPIDRIRRHDGPLTLLVRLLLVALLLPLLFHVTSRIPPGASVEAWQPAPPPRLPVDLDLGPSGVAFDRATGLLAIAARPHARELHVSFDITGSPQIAIDGVIMAHGHLDGLSAAALRAIDVQGDSRMTLTLDGLQLPGALVVQSTMPMQIPDGIRIDGDLSLYAPQISLGGRISAANLGLISSGLIEVLPGSEVNLRHGVDGGQLVVAGRTFVQGGVVQANGRLGGAISAEADYLIQQGELHSDGIVRGGRIELRARRSYQDVTRAETTAFGWNGAAGSITIDAGVLGHVLSSGRHLAAGSSGGSIHLSGDRVALVDATLDAGGQPGDGGVVQVRAVTDLTQRGMLLARGGMYGNGGRIEVLAHGSLTFGGSTDVTAVNGSAGVVWIDPKNITIADPPLGILPQFELIDPNPNAGNQFGWEVVALSTGNLVVTSPYDDAGATDAGAAYLYNGATGALISTLIGSLVDDHVGRYPFSGDISVTALANGNYVISSLEWGESALSGSGAVTWGSGITGVSGTVSAANSLLAGPGAYWAGYGYYGGVKPLPNGNYVVTSVQWNNGAVQQAGAVTWGDGATGTTGIISAANSLVGTTEKDQVGYRVTVLANGNYVVASSPWDNGTIANAGAVTWGSGASGVSGVVSATNSLVGVRANSYVGSEGVVALTNGNHVVVSPRWVNEAGVSVGAATWANGTTGLTGAVAPANSLVGSSANDGIGSGGVTALTNGSYVISSPGWDNGVVTNAGAVTWGNGTNGMVGVVGAANSLVGSTADDQVGSCGVTTFPDMSQAYCGVAALSNGNYTVSSRFWDNGAIANAGAVTWGDGTNGTAGVVGVANSLVGSSRDDWVGYGGDMTSGITIIYQDGVTPLANGGYAVRSPFWDNGVLTDAGAVTWSGPAGIQGAISAANSLVGSTANDQVGSSGLVALANGNYVVASQKWDSPTAVDAGAVTWGDGTQGMIGTITSVNSLVGTSANDRVGHQVVALVNGNYVVTSVYWTSPTSTEIGAATWGDGTRGITGPISRANSLTGTAIYDAYPVIALPNGNYLVVSPTWSSETTSYIGAITWGDGTIGTRGPISASNSIIGATAYDAVGFGAQKSVYDPVFFSGLSIAPNGDYVFRAPIVDNGPIVNAGAVSWGDGATGRSSTGFGAVTAQNSILGRVTSVSSANLQEVVWDHVNGTFLARFLIDGAGRVVVGIPRPRLLTYGRAPETSQSIAPAHLAEVLNTGGALTLQASNDLTISSTLALANPVGAGGALTLQSGRSIVISDSITTDGGALSLRANEPLSSGVIDLQRDPGAAVIRMADGAAIETGAGMLTIDLRDGAGKTNRAIGGVTLGRLMVGGLNVATADAPVIFSGDLTLGGDAAIDAGSGAVSIAGRIDAGQNTAGMTGGSVAFQSGAILALAIGGTGASGQLVVNGQLALGGAALRLTVAPGQTLLNGQQVVLVVNDGSDPVDGLFAGLPEGANLVAGGVTFEISYGGGDGNDITLTVLSGGLPGGTATPTATRTPTLPVRVSLPFAARP